MLLQQLASAATTRFAYDGLDRIAEYDGSNTLLRRYVHGTGDDEPLVWYEGSGTTDRRFLSSDERGSIVSLTDTSGALLGINKYDEYGRPAAGNLGAFGYTGQAWLSDIGAYYYKARVYDPELGRFLQTDPIGYGAGPNLYAYVLNDPVNLVDPLGLHCRGPFEPGAIVICKQSESGGGLPPSSGGINPGGPTEGPSPGCVRNRTCLPPREQPPPQKKATEPCTPTSEQLQDSGTVNFKFTEATATYGLLYSHIEGSFTTTGGYSGWFETSVKGLFFGSGTGVAGGFGTSQSLATFTGQNYNVVGSLGPYSISDNYSTSGSHVGQTDAAATPGLGLGATVSNTIIRDVQCPVQAE